MNTTQRRCGVSTILEQLTKVSIRACFLSKLDQQLNERQRVFAIICFNNIDTSHSRTTWSSRNLVIVYQRAPI